MAVEDRIAYLIAEALKGLDTSSELTEQVGYLARQIKDLTERISILERQRMTRSRKPGDE